LKRKAQETVCAIVTGNSKLQLTLLQNNVLTNFVFHWKQYQYCTIQDINKTYCKHQVT